MFDGINKVIIMGEISNNPEVKYTNIGTSFITVSVTTRSVYKDRTAEKFNYKVEWHKVVLYGKVAESVSANLIKGSIVYLEGSLRTNKWQDEDGKYRYSTEVLASSLKVLNLDESVNNENQNFDIENLKFKKADKKDTKSFFDEDSPF